MLTDHREHLYAISPSDLAIYDRVQAFDTAGAGIMSAALLLISLIAIGFAYFTTSRTRTQRHG